MRLFPHNLRLCSYTLWLFVPRVSELLAPLNPTDWPVGPGRLRAKSSFVLLRKLLRRYLLIIMDTASEHLHNDLLERYLGESDH